MVLYSKSTQEKREKTVKEEKKMRHGKNKIVGGRLHHLEVNKSEYDFDHFIKGTIIYNGKERYFAFKSGNEMSTFFNRIRELEDKLIQEQNICPVHTKSKEKEEMTKT